jgi:hypothetical protein
MRPQGYGMEDSIEEVQWEVRTPIVYRYMEEEYVNAFFETGSLRLSSFANFISSNDAERFDAEEGRTFLVAKTAELGGQTVACWHECGREAYVLCGSTEYSRDLGEAFDEACIQINDTRAFAMEIVKCIPDFVDGMEGPCTYQNKKIIEKDVGYLPLSEIRDSNDPSRLDVRRMRKWLHRVGGVDVYFLKPLRYRKQSEYRFVWRTNSEIAAALTIECPEAIKHCQRPSAWSGVEAAVDGPPRALIPTETDSVSECDARHDRASPFPRDWRRRHAICFPPAQDDLEDFSIRLTRGALNDEICEPSGPYSAQQDGGDIRFSLDKEGIQQLPVDIIKFGYDSRRNARDANVDIRVLVPAVPSSHCLTVFVWYCADHAVTQPPPRSRFGRLSAYGEHWESYYPEADQDRLGDN